MAAGTTLHSSGSGDPPRGVLRESLRFWERGRIGYNAVLTGVVAAWVAATWPHFRPALTLRSALLMAVLAALANLCYCAAYPVDLVLARSAFSGAWRRWRWALWWAGMALAVLLACYWIADEIYPGVG